MALLVNKKGSILQIQALFNHTRPIDFYMDRPRTNYMSHNFPPSTHRTSKHLDFTDCMFKDPEENQYSAFTAQSSGFWDLGEHHVCPFVAEVMGLVSPTHSELKKNH